MEFLLAAPLKGVIFVVVTKGSPEGSFVQTVYAVDLQYTLGSTTAPTPTIFLLITLATI